MKNLLDIKYWIFDLDNTLYSGQTKVFSEVDRKMSAFISKKMNVDRSKKGLGRLPSGYIPKPEKKREKIRGFVNDMLRYDVNGNFVNNII